MLDNAAVGLVAGYTRNVDDAAPARRIGLDSIPPTYSGLGVDYWQYDDYGRVRQAGNNTCLLAYLADNDAQQAGVQSWNGDWNDIRYPPIEYRNDIYDYYSQLLSYLCQRFLDLTAPANPTLTETQKAVLAAQVLQDRPGDDATFHVFLSNYVRSGNVFEGFDFSNWNNANREFIEKMTDKLAEIEKQANLPNVEMREANRLIEQVAAEARGTVSHFSAGMRGIPV